MKLLFLTLTFSVSGYLRLSCRKKAPLQLSTQTHASTMQISRAQSQSRLWQLSHTNDFQGIGMPVHVTHNEQGLYTVKGLAMSPNNKVTWVLFKTSTLNRNSGAMTHCHFNSSQGKLDQAVASKWVDLREMWKCVPKTAWVNQCSVTEFHLGLWNLEFSNQGLSFS